MGDATQQAAALQCDFTWAAGNPTCAGMYALWGGGAWPNNGNGFADYSASYAINYDANFPTPLDACEKPQNVKGNWYRPTQGVSECVFANWCNGINMHHDWTFSGPAPWGNLAYAPYPNPSDPDAAGPATQFGGMPDYEQIMFRYTHVPCRSWHHTLGAGTPYPNINVRLRACLGLAGGSVFGTSFSTIYTHTPNTQHCTQGCGGDRRCIKRCRVRFGLWFGSSILLPTPNRFNPTQNIPHTPQSTCKATCKRLANDLEKNNCTAFTGGARTKCKFRVKAFSFGCQSICAQPLSA